MGSVPYDRPNICIHRELYIIERERERQKVFYGGFEGPSNSKSLYKPMGLSMVDITRFCTFRRSPQ